MLQKFHRCAGGCCPCHPSRINTANRNVAERPASSLRCKLMNTWTDYTSCTSTSPLDAAEFNTAARGHASDVVYHVILFL